MTTGMIAQLRIPLKAYKERREQKNAIRAGSVKIATKQRGGVIDGDSDWSADDEPPFSLRPQEAVREPAENARNLREQMERAIAEREEIEQVRYGAAIRRKQLQRAMVARCAEGTQKKEQIVAQPPMQAAAADNFQRLEQGTLIGERAPPVVYMDSTATAPHGRHVPEAAMAADEQAEWPSVVASMQEPEKSEKLMVGPSKIDAEVGWGEAEGDTLKLPPVFQPMDGDPLMAYSKAIACGAIP
jgi:hypothetical protein